MPCAAAPFAEEDARRALEALLFDGRAKAYARGAHRFKGQTRDALLDDRGRPWKVTEDALIRPGGERLARLPGELAYWFGWFAFFPTTELYGGAALN